MFNSRGVSPIVSILLLTILTVIVVSTFQTWITGFSSGALSDAEIKATYGEYVEIVALVGSNLYINSDFNSISINLKVNSQDCLTSIILNESINELNVNSCLISANATGITEFFLVHSEGTSTKKFFVGN